MDETKSNVTIEVALLIFRRLSGTEGYPFHEPGEIRFAEVLGKYTSGVAHAKATVDEFDGEQCPTVEQLRTTAIRLAEHCRCGYPLWMHRNRETGEACKSFIHGPSEEAQWKKSGNTMEQIRESVPMIVGVPWEICLQIHCIRLELQHEDGYLLQYEREYPEAVADLRAGRHPDPAVVEKRMRALKPWMFTRERLTFGQQILEKIKKENVVF